VFFNQVFISCFEMLNAEHLLVPTCFFKVRALEVSQLFKRVIIVLPFLSAGNCRNLLGSSKRASAPLLLSWSPSMPGTV
jgi:hypothetical protein